MKCGVMVLGFVLIVTEPAAEQEVYKALMEFDGSEYVRKNPNSFQIKDVHPLFGEYDMLAEVEAESFDEMGRVIVEYIRNIPGVHNTKTLAGIRL